MRRQRGFDSLLHEHETSNQSVGTDEMNRPPCTRDSRVTMNSVLDYEGDNVTSGGIDAKINPSIIRYLDDSRLRASRIRPEARVSRDPDEN